MRTIHKFNIVNSRDVQDIEMPKGAKICTVAHHFSSVFIWAIVDTDQELETRSFTIYGTGRPIQEGHEYIDSFKEEVYVWHLFEVK